MVDHRLEALRVLARQKMRSLSSPHPAFTLFLSVGSETARARVIHASADSFDAAWDRMLASKPDGSARWLRLDWPTGVEALTWKEFESRLNQTKRTYFRHGVALDAGFRFAFLEQELNANAMLYGGNKIPHAIWNAKNAAYYAKARLGCVLPKAAKVYLFPSAGLFCGDDGAIHSLAETGLDAGHRRINVMEPDIVGQMVETSSAYLARQVQPDGRFAYGTHPCFDRAIPTYNTLRHTSTTYAMIEAWEVTRDPVLREAIERAVRHLTETLIRPATLPDGTEAAFLIDRGNEVKLGGSGVALLALTRYCTAFETDVHLPLLERLACGIGQFQQADGSFRHVLNWPGLRTRQACRTIYYEGEATFGLLRLYDLTRDARWLEMVERAFQHFIRHDYWQYHDHWLSYCVNELTLHRPDPAYFRFGLRNVSGYLDFVANRITTFPTLLELMMAAQAMLARIAADPALHPLLEEIDLPGFVAALEKRALYLTNGYFWPELAMYYARPERILGAFFIRHQAFRVRIDDVEHYLSGLIAYGRYLPQRAAFKAKITACRSDEPGWSADEVAAATGGAWLHPPAESWRASGLCIYAPSMQPGNMVAARTEGVVSGLMPTTIARMNPPPAAILTSAPDTLPDLGLPVLHVADMRRAVLDLGVRARDRLQGRVIGITGSAGKTTTTAMMSHALGAYGPAAQTRDGANLPVGVAWNLASVPRDTPHMVLEMAIGSMRHSARMARPHVAVFTNILPAHLVYHNDTRTIARKKSAIFLGMGPAGTAVLNRDMQEFDIVCAAAQARGVRVLTYGTVQTADLRLLSHDETTGMVSALVNGREMQWQLGAGGAHMALNSLAVLGGVLALGLPPEPALMSLADFRALQGRGQVVNVRLNGRQVTIIDDAYNANPGSMSVALHRLTDLARGRRSVAVLGQMAELGQDEERYHTELAGLVSGLAISEVHVVGPLYTGFWDRLPPQTRGSHAGTLDCLKQTLRQNLRDGDVVLFKGSNATQIHQVVDWIKQLA